jgi:hypothetical protein
VGAEHGFLFTMQVNKLKAFENKELRKKNEESR